MFDLMFSQLTQSSVINVEQLVDSIFNSNNSSPYLYCTSVVSAGVDITTKDYVEQCMQKWYNSTITSSNCKSSVYNTNTGSNVINNSGGGSSNCNSSNINVSTQLNKYGYSVEDCTHIYEQLHDLYLKYEASSSEM